MPIRIITGLVAVVLFATLLPLSRRTVWWIRDLDFPRLQIAIIAFVLLIMQFALLDWRDDEVRALIAVNLACLLYQAWWIFPYTRVFPNEVKVSPPGLAEDRIRILTANVLAPNHNAAGLIALIREHKPHIFVTLESDSWCRNGWTRWRTSTSTR